MKIEDRVASISENGREVATVAETELRRRVVYLTRAHVLVGVLADTLAVMTKAEGQVYRATSTTTGALYGCDWHMRRAGLSASSNARHCRIEDHERA
jgi:outer membrane lipopolysaccharide assembly protein LptE/RlpB